MTPRWVGALAAVLSAVLTSTPVAAHAALAPAPAATRLARARMPFMSWGTTCGFVEVDVTAELLRGPEPREVLATALPLVRERACTASAYDEGILVAARLFADRIAPAELETLAAFFESTAGAHAAACMPQVVGEIAEASRRAGAELPGPDRRWKERGILALRLQGEDLRPLVALRETAAWHELDAARDEADRLSREWMQSRVRAVAAVALEEGRRSPGTPPAAPPASADAIGFARAMFSRESWRAFLSAHASAVRRQGAGPLTPDEIRQVERALLDALEDGAPYEEALRIHARAVGEKLSAADRDETLAFHSTAAGRLALAVEPAVWSRSDVSSMEREALRAQLARAALPRDVVAVLLGFRASDVGARLSGAEADAAHELFRWAFQRYFFAEPAMWARARAALGRDPRATPPSSSSPAARP